MTGSLRPCLALTVLAAALLVGACGADAPQVPGIGSATPTPPASATVAASASPAPATATPPASTPTATALPSPPVSPSPTPWPAPSALLAPDGSGAQGLTGDGWLKKVLFAPDGHIVLIEDPPRTGNSRVIMLDAEGRILDGWPWTPGRDGETFASGALGPDGSVYVTARTLESMPSQPGDEATWTQELHRLDANGRDLPGFPFTQQGVPLCHPATGPSGDLYTVCVSDGEDGLLTSSLARVRQDGSMPDGWPVEIDGSVQIIGFRPGGDVVLVVARESGTVTLTVLHPDGTEAAGWPRPIPDYPARVVDRLGRTHLAAPAVTEGDLESPAGTGDDACGTITAMTYTVLGDDGAPRPGWPVAVRGWASEPLVADDGTTTIVTAAGAVIRYGRRGNVLEGWPVRGVPVTVVCGQGSMPVPAGRDGFVVAGDGRVTLVRAGGIARGWPVKPAGRLADDSWLRESGPGVPRDPAVGRKGIWVAAYQDGRPVVHGIARDGSMPKAWSRTVGEEGDRIQWIRIAPSGRVWMLLDRPVDGQGGNGSSTWILVPVAEDLPLAE